MDEAGRPVPRVLVRAPTEGLPTGYELAECEVTSDGDGRFEMRLAPGLDYRFYATKDGYGLVEQPAVEVTAEGAPPVVLVMSDAIRTYGRVVDPEGKPFPGLQVSVDRVYEKSGSYVGKRRLSTTDPEGRFSFEDIPAGMKFRLTVVADGSGRDDDRTFVARPGAPEIVIVLRPEGVVVRVKLSDPEGGSFADYVVRFIRPDGRTQVLSTRKDLEGRVFLARIRAGTYQVVAVPRKGGACHDLGEVVLKDGVETKIERKLPSPGTIRVRVSDAAGRSTKGAVVVVRAARPSPLDRILVNGMDAYFEYRYPVPDQLHLEREYKTGSDGTVEVGPLAPGEYVVESSGARRRVIVTPVEVTEVSLP